MSDGKKVKRWTLNWPQEISVTCIGGDAIQSGSTVVLASDHDRIVAEIKEGNYAFSEQIAKQRYTIDELRAEVEKLERALEMASNSPEDRSQEAAHYNWLDDKMEKLEATIARQARAIEKLKERLTSWISETHPNDEHLRNMCLMVEEREIAAIEKEAVK